MESVRDDRGPEYGHLKDLQHKKLHNLIDFKIRTSPFAQSALRKFREGMKGGRCGLMIKSDSDVDRNEVVLRGLVEDGYVVIPDFYSLKETEELSAVARLRREDEQFKAAAIGRGDEAQRHSEIRSDFIHWLSADDPAPPVRRYLGFLDELREAMNRELLLGLFEYEGHFAAYPPGSFYKRHLDCFQDQQRRRVTTIMYLNEGTWSEGDGGQLRIYPPKGDDLLCEVLPAGGTFVAFLSDQFPHEVLPTNRERLSLTGWFCRRPIGNALVF